jgi:flagellar protein FliS
LKEANDMVNPYEVYQRNQVTMAKPEELTLMLYNGSVKFLQLAKLAIEKKEWEKAHSFIMRTEDIINELIVTLNMDYDISKSLAALYDYMKRRLVEANIKKDIIILEEVEQMLMELKTTWSQAMKSVTTA